MKIGEIQESWSIYVDVPLSAINLRLDRINEVNEYNFSQINELLFEHTGINIKVSKLYIISKLLLQVDL